MVNQTDQTVKVSPTFLQRLIDAVCYITQMYKVELRYGNTSHISSPPASNFLEKNVRLSALHL